MGRSGIRILAMDDERPVLDALPRLFTTAPDMVYLGGTSSAADLYRHVELGEPDLVLLDTVGAPPTPEVIRHIAARWPSVKTVVYSSSVDAMKIDDAIEAGAWGCITKLTSSQDTLGLLRRAHAGEVVLSNEARLLLGMGRTTR